MNSIKKNSIITVAVFLMFLLTAVAISAANLDFTPAQSSVKPDNTFTVQVTIDPGTEQIAGTDINMLFDSGYLEVQSVTAGSYFPLVNNIVNTGKLYISGVVANPGEYKTGVGTVATVTFKALQEGTTTITYDCNLSNTETSKIVKNDINASNVIDCSANGDHAVTISADATSTSTGGTTTTTGGTTQLPQSGVYEDMIRAATIGGIFLVIGACLRLLMRII